METLGLILTIALGLVLAWGVFASLVDANPMPSDREPAFEAVGMARAWARKTGIRVRPVKQAMVKAYMKRANQTGLSHASKLWLSAQWCPVKPVYRRRVTSRLTLLDLAFS